MSLLKCWPFALKHCTSQECHFYQEYFIYLWKDGYFSGYFFTLIPAGGMEEIKPPEHPTTPAEHKKAFAMNPRSNHAPILRDSDREPQMESLSPCSERPQRASNSGFLAPPEASCHWCTQGPGSKSLEAYSQLCPTARGPSHQRSHIRSDSHSQCRKSELTPPAPVVALQEPLYTHAVGDTV